MTQSPGTISQLAAPSITELSLTVNVKIEKSSNDQINYDVIVLGIGSMGSTRGPVLKTGLSNW